MTPEEEDRMRKTVLSATNHLINLQQRACKENSRYDNKITQKNKKVRYNATVEEIKEKL